MDRKLAVVDIVGLTPGLIGEHTPNLKKHWDKAWQSRLKEPFPAVTCTSQACMLTGVNADVHGIVGNGWYFRELAEVGFWKQNNGLIHAEKVWDSLRKQKPGATCAQLFWWYNMYSKVNWSVTPRPHYPADGRKVFDIYTHPMELGADLKKELGAFPFFNFWGPGAGIGSSQWIAESARRVCEMHNPDLQFVYLPHLDYGLQKYGPKGVEIPTCLRELDGVAGDLLEYYQKRGIETLVVSEYGVSEVHRVIHPNRVLRENGWISVRRSLNWEMLECGECAAFAVADHQICHIYLRDPSRSEEVVRLFEGTPGTRMVLAGADRGNWHLNHDRAGDVILMAEPDSWYSYYYWMDDSLAPDFARCVDIHRKPGYDPVELFIDPNIAFPKLKIGTALLKKKLGFRYYMDVIPLQPELVRGSHGTPATNAQNAPLVFSSYEEWNPKSEELPMTAVRDLILNYFK